MNRRIYLSSFLALMIVLCLKFLAGHPMTEQAFEWYYNLKTPKIIPSNMVFAVSWTAIYTLMAGALANLFICYSLVDLREFLGIFAVQSVLHVGWTYLFFGQQDICSGFVCMIALLLSVMLMLFYTYKLSVFSAILFLPYISWLSFATYISWQIVRLNPCS